MSPLPPAKANAEMALFGIYEISKILTRPSRLETTLSNVVNVLTSFLQMRRGMIVVLDSADEVEIVAAAGWAEQKHGAARAIDSLPRPVIDRIVATTTPLVVQDVAHEPLFAGAKDLDSDRAEARVSFVGVPIKVDLKVVGTLSIDRVWDGRTQFRIDDDLRFLSMVANLVGQTVRLHRILAADRQRLLDERGMLEKALGAELAERHAGVPKVEGIVGESDAVRRVLATIAVVAKSNSTVLLRGESGTGKELFARAIHDLSPRKAKAFIKLNCAALPESVLESELFGHEKGAFTGAVGQRAGRFELAHGGTLLLDEIGEISPSFQAKLLRILQEGEFERVGGSRTLKVDVRLVCATNKNLEEAVAKGEFRADLYYRINVVPVFLPPLRERPGDIPHLARAFVGRFNAENGRKLTLAPSGLDVLSHCYFPGNVRELENCVRRTATLTHGETITAADFACHSGDCLSSLLWKSAPKKPGAPDPITVLASGFPVVAPTPLPAAAPPPPAAFDSSGESGPAGLCEHADANCPALGGRPSERERLIDAMERSGWVQAKAARIMGLTPRQIGYALKKHGIELKRF
ncbi:nif-specific transcriptional activator NifA [Siculibacillus lacustris]|uniref:Nif-specific regulatory protein n=2 Tax=Siculibacillus lacustris TaxID=1549641 RepID=A0A4Q9VR58_9HYPH|nr:nif-specific transcriptional activator NifA [Siculibacillus lacustris]TBW38061.1 nif-specific transcriptional activator NifA [Siculibacillus lacustris]